jgi:azurin
MVTPIGFKVHSNGLRIDFNEVVEVGVPENYFVQQWNYEYAKRYGSPEFSINDPKQLGHDRVAVASVRSLNGGKSVFLEMPDIVPAMQMHVRMHLNVGKKDLFPTIVELGEPFKFDGMKDLIADKPRVLKPRIRGKKASATAKDQSPPDETWAAARRIELKTIESLRFDKTELKAKPGEKLVFTLHNDDVMPHNFVLVYPDSKAKVGQASFKMLNDPEAEAKSYVPTELNKEVIAKTAVVYPKSKQVIYFQAPKKAGDYPFICTFPGHWQIMQGVLKVAE